MTPVQVQALRTGDTVKRVFGETIGRIKTVLLSTIYVQWHGGAGDVIDKASPLWHDLELVKEKP